MPRILEIDESNTTCLQLRLEHKQILRAYWGMISKRTFDHSGRTWTVSAASASACGPLDSNDPRTLYCIQGTRTAVLPYEISYVPAEARVG